MEHAVHVASKHFVQDTGPKSRQAANGGEVDDDDGDDRTDTRDSLGKAMGLVKQVRLPCHF